MADGKGCEIGNRANSYFWGLEMKREKLKKLIREVAEQSFRNQVVECEWCAGLVSKEKAIRRVVAGGYFAYHVLYYHRDCAEVIAKQGNYKIIHCPNCDETHLVKKETKK